MTTGKLTGNGSGTLSSASAAFQPAIGEPGIDKLFADKVLYYYAEGYGHTFEAYQEVDLIVRGEKRTEPMGIWLRFVGASLKDRVAFFRLGEIFVEMTIELKEGFVFKPNEGRLEGEFEGSFSLYPEQYSVTSGRIERQFIPRDQLKKGNPYTSSHS